MRLIKKKKIFFILLALIVIMIDSCGYEDGPSMSFRSAKKRLVRKWKLETYLYSGQDQTSSWLALYPDYSIEYRLNNTYEVFTNDTGTYSYGTWSFMDNGKTLERQPNSSPGTYNDHKILKLTTKELWTIFNETDEFHFSAEK